MKRSNAVLIAAGALFALSIANLLRSRGHEVSAAGTNAGAARATLIAAPGRVEAASEEVRVRSELSGRRKRGPAEEAPRLHPRPLPPETRNAPPRPPAP